MRALHSLTVGTGRVFVILTLSFLLEVKFWSRFYLSQISLIFRPLLYFTSIILLSNFYIYVAFPRTRPFYKRILPELFKIFIFTIFNLGLFANPGQSSMDEPSFWCSHVLFIYNCCLCFSGFGTLPHLVGNATEQTATHHYAHTTTTHTTTHIQ